MCLSQPYSAEEASTFLIMTERVVHDLEVIVQTFNTLSPDSNVTSLLHAVYTLLAHIRTNRDFHSIPVLLKKVSLVLKNILLQFAVFTSHYCVSRSTIDFQLGMKERVQL